MRIRRTKKNRRMMKGRKAQITVFMIIGIILLFSTAVVMYIKNQVAEQLPADFAPAVEEVPLEAQPVKLYVENCLNKIAEDGFRSLGAHVGYIDPPDPTYGEKFGVGPIPTESHALSVFGGKKDIVPYWWFLKSPNNCLQNCEFYSYRPPLTKAEHSGEMSMEEQMQIYIKRNLGRCIQGFQTFKKEGFIIKEKGKPEPEVKFTDKDVAILLNYPIEVSKEGRTTEIKQFFTKSDVNIKGVYELAKQIVDKEVKRKFLEEHSLNLIAMYSKPIGMDRLPPMSYFNLNPAGEYLIWTRTETQQRMESYVLPPGISMLQILYTANQRRNVIFDKEGVDRVNTGIMDKTSIMVNETPGLENMEVRFAYLDWWPIYLDINKGAEVLKPQSIGPMIIAPLMDLIGMDKYRFLYSYSFPVLVTITDPFAFNGDGFKFTFAMEANVRRNAPMNSTFRDVPPTPKVSLLCDRDQRNAGPTKVILKEKFTGKPVTGARVEFVAGGEACYIGNSEIDENGEASVKDKFPVGIGEIVVKDPDYLPIRVPIFSKMGEEAEHTIELMPIFTVNASVELKALSYQQGRYVLPEVPITSMSPKESAVIMLERQDDDEYGDFSSYLMYNITGGPQEMTLVPGTYEVNGYLILKDKIVIPKETKTISIPFKKDKKISVNETVLKNWMEGAVILNNVTGFWTVTENDLLNHNKIKFKMLRWPKPVTHSKEFGPGPALDQVSEHEKTCDIYRQELEPEWE